MSTHPHQDEPGDANREAARNRPENRNDAGRRPGMHPEAQKSGTGSKGTMMVIVGALVLGLLVYALVGAGIIGN
ncbi:hypothetical protein [Egicoccus sp. AB-alg6-2]|uniref:hypothetical protein n=1 Tax=Egicoccus sp. AB-alg6-2 TaxID=3242692 RepID=UPI00359DCC1F